jgi:hypothetical protein
VGFSDIKGVSLKTAHPEEPVSLSNWRLEGRTGSFEMGLRQAQSLLRMSGMEVNACLSGSPSTPQNAARPRRVHEHGGGQRKPPGTLAQVQQKTLSYSLMFC